MVKYIEFNDDWFTYFYCEMCGHKEFTKPDICPQCGAKVVKSTNSNRSEEVYNQYTDTIGRHHWTGVNSGKHHS